MWVYCVCTNTYGGTRVGQSFAIEEPKWYATRHRTHSMCGFFFFFSIEDSQCRCWSARLTICACSPSHFHLLRRRAYSNGRQIMWSKLYYIAEIEKKIRITKMIFELVVCSLACLLARSFVRRGCIPAFCIRFQCDRVSFDSKTSRVSFTNGFRLLWLYHHTIRIEIHALINATRTI